MSHVDEGTLHAYLDGELPPAEAQGVAAHVARCPACRGRLDEERALIARADELLGLAAPPDRTVPPFPVGDRKPPARLWWQVRWPLAWAATLALALGIGLYIGRGAAPSARRLAPNGEPKLTQAPETVAQHPAITGRSLPPLDRRAESAADRLAAASEGAAPPAANVAAPGARAVDESGFSLDSARAVLGQDPVLLPGAPVRAVRRDGRTGYAGGVVIEQQLDSQTVVELVERRRAPAAVAALVVNAPEEDVSRTAAPARKQAAAPRALAKARADSAVRLFDSLHVRISGPLPTDSLMKLLQHVQPARP